jgi:hypothetical protein
MFEIVGNTACMNSISRFQANSKLKIEGSISIDSPDVSDANAMIVAHMEKVWI